MFRTIDWTIMIVYFVFVLGIGAVLKRYVKTSTDFFLAGQSIPAWVAGLAFLSANLGAQEVIGMGASGAKYGIATSHFYWIGAIPAMVFVGVFMMPFYYGSRARSVPEYLRLRFDEKTRGLNAVSFAVMTLFSSGISMYAMAKLIQILHIFDAPFAWVGLPQAWIFHLSLVISALVVLGYILLGGLTSAIYNEVVQFFLIVAGFLPLVWLGLKNIGGWQGLKANLDPSYTHSWLGMSNPHTNRLGVEWFGLTMGLGFVLSFGSWCTDFLVIQRAMAANSMNSARCTPLHCSLPQDALPVPGHPAGIDRDCSAHAESRQSGGHARRHHHRRTRLDPGQDGCVRSSNPGQGRDHRARLRPGHSQHALALLSYRNPGPRSNRAAGQLHVRHGGKRDRVQYRVDVRHLPVVHK